MKTCKRCVMDETTKFISFDSNNFCNFCNEFSKINSAPKISGQLPLIKRIKKDGKGKKYDCIVGMSGGVDSSYVLHLVVKSGLRPLAVHMDNNWNAELATHNISNLINKLKVDLYTHVIDWNEYRELLLSFIKSNVVDIELLYDNAMWGVNLSLAKKYNLKYILSGSNLATEGFSMPKDWNWYKLDKKNILDIFYKNSNKKMSLKSFPFASSIDYAIFQFFHGGRWVSFLDYYEYSKNKALEVLKNEYDYKPYPYKHYESVLTRFYQGYILPKKFNIDKRKLHLSNLIMTGEISRSDAMKDLSSIPYESDRLLELDKQFFLKKMRMSEDELNNYINLPRKEHDVYKSEVRTKNMLLSFKKLIDLKS